MISNTLHKLYISTFFSLFLVWLCSFNAVGQMATLESFGKNRVQHKDFDWKVITTQNFEIYYYQGGNEHAYFAARHAESDFDRITDLLGYTPYSKLNLFVYNYVIDLQQSNVGLANDNNLIVGGQTNFIKSRVEIPYPGTAVGFKKEITLGVTRMMIVEMMFGGSLKDMVQSSYLLTLPEWFIAGASAYVAEGWSLEMDDYVRDAIVNKNLKKPSVLTGDDAVLVGQSIWNFIAERYGKSNISNILNLTRIIRNEENSIASTLGISYPRFLNDWRSYYTNLNGQVIGAYTMPKEDLRVRRNNRNRFTYNQVRISPNGQTMAYSENFRGKYNLIVRQIQGKKEFVVMSGGYRTINQRFDTEIPLINWKNNNQLIVVHTSAGQYWLSVYDVTRRFNRRVSRKSLGSFDQIKDFDVSDDGRTLVLSASRNGHNDLYLYQLGGGGATQLTNDLYDDLNPQFMSGSNSSVVFSSNRRTDTLSAKASVYTIDDRFNLFKLDQANPGNPAQLTNSPGSETMPLVANAQTIFFLSDVTGIRQVYQFDLTSGKTQPVTAFRQNVQSFHINMRDSSLAFLTLKDRRRFIGYDRGFNFGSEKPTVPTRRSQLTGESTNFVSDNKSTVPNGKVTGVSDSVKTVAQDQQLTLREGEVDTDNYQFDRDTRRIAEDEKEPKTQRQPAETASNQRQNQNVTIRGPFAYHSRFTTDNIVSSVLIDPIRGLGVLFNLSMNDILEDHQINGGLIGFTDLQSSNFFGEYKYLKKRWDAGVRFDRKTYYFNELSDGFIQKYNLNKVQLFVSYPLNVASRVSFAPVFMTTRFVETGSSVTNVQSPIRTTSFAGFQAEYVFDNTVVNGLNMIEGTRMKIRFENHLGIKQSGQSFNNLSIDIRNYKKIHRDIIFATRLAFGRFGGNSPKNYLLGGMDNWIFNRKEPRENNNPLAIVPVRTASPDWSVVDNRNILFNEFATNLRGFRYNKVSGSTYILFNAELRFPIIKYFYRGPITSNFFKNLQLVGFADIGTAWSGTGPFSRQNSLNTETVGDLSQPGNYFQATVTNFKNPFLSGYGVGARTLLLGYYVKFDAAWGVEDYVVGVPRYYLTLGYDF